MLGPARVERERRLLEPARHAATRELAETIAGYQEGFTWLRDPRFVTIAAVQGHAVGAGFQLALAVRPAGGRRRRAVLA